MDSFMYKGKLHCDGVVYEPIDTIHSKEAKWCWDRYNTQQERWRKEHPRDKETINPIVIGIVLGLFLFIGASMISFIKNQFN